MNVLQKIAAEISGENAYELTRRVTEFNRSPGSSGYHAATGLVRDALVECGLRIEETRYPLDGATVALDRTMPLAWEPVAGASRYAFQVSRSRLFVDNVIDVANRTRPRATLGLRGEGSFLERLGNLHAGRTELLRRPLQDARARVLGPVDAMTEAHDASVLVEKVLYVAGRVA